MAKYNTVASSANLKKEIIGCRWTLSKVIKGRGEWTEIRVGERERHRDRGQDGQRSRTIAVRLSYRTGI